MASASSAQPKLHPRSFAPRPTSLRTLVADFFLLSFRDHKDPLLSPLPVPVAQREGSEPNPHTGKVAPNSVFERRLEQLLWWPPDLFALTSILLGRTGTYRHVVGPDNDLGMDLWRNLDWQPRVEAHAEAWRATASGFLLPPYPEGPKRQTHFDCSSSQTEGEAGAQDPSLMQRFFDVLDYRIRDRCGRRAIAPLPRVLRTRMESIAEEDKGKEAQDSAATVGERTHPFCLPPNLIRLFLHDLSRLADEDGALADQNILALSAKLAKQDTKRKKIDSESPVRHFFEALIGLNVLADAAAGSVGLPRSSTQESTVFDTLANLLLTLRGSLSICPKFHGVLLPKMRTPQVGLTLRNLSHNLTFHNSETEVMWRSFPWSNLDENTLNVLYVPYPFAISPTDFEIDNNYFESVGYFTYKPKEWNEIGAIVDLLDKVQKEQGISPHFLVFTETALDEDSYKRLLTALSRRYGENSSKKNLTKIPVVVAGVGYGHRDKDKEPSIPRNELRLATYFAGKWYQLVQQKHHRWRLNADQIRQYGLEGRLSTARPLFERSVIEQRRLTFYAPAPWLVLSPLICEDLARTEPISQLVRGVGPTLLLALLFDGPQLNARWPARYASVLADDPGTGVLTVTSYGAARSSKQSTPSTNDPQMVARESSEEYEAVASWKDPNSPFRALNAKHNEALLITLTASMTTEFSLDGRGNDGKAGGFRLDGVRPYLIPESGHDPGIDQNLDLGTWSDIREVTALTYVASSALSLLRPHASLHPNDDMRLQKADGWFEMKDWPKRVRHARALVDIMLGQPALTPKRDWDKEVEKQCVSIASNPDERVFARELLFTTISEAFEEWANKREVDKNCEFKEFTKEINKRYNREGFKRGIPEGVREKLENDQIFKLKVRRSMLNEHLFYRSGEHEGFRHVYSTLSYAQSAIDIEVRDEEAVWGTDSVRYGARALRLVIDMIAGVKTDEAISLESGDISGLQKVVLRRLRIAGRDLRRRGNAQLWNLAVTQDNEVDEKISLRDVIEAPVCLRRRGRKGPTGRESQLDYLGSFRNHPSAAGVHDPLHSTEGFMSGDPQRKGFMEDGLGDNSYKLPDVHANRPTRYDFFHMILAVIDALIRDREFSFWQTCRDGIPASKKPDSESEPTETSGESVSKKEIRYPTDQPFDGHLSDTEMRRLALLVLMTFPALIHEQLEYEYIRLKGPITGDLRRGVIKQLIDRCEEILELASKMTHQPQWGFPDSR
ncbi:MAG: hypothetical protein AAF809_04790 [Bacteroidota bacterium]